jgi:hypothetical protein
MSTLYNQHIFRGTYNRTTQYLAPPDQPYPDMVSTPLENQQSVFDPVAGGYVTINVLTPALWEAKHSNINAPPNTTPGDANWRMFRLLGPSYISQFSTSA